MHKKKSIIKVSIVSFLIVIGLVLSFVPFRLPNFWKYNAFINSIKLGIDLKGGVYAVYDVKDAEDDADLDARLDGTVSRLHTLLTDKGYTESTVTREGATRIRVEVPDVDDPQKIFQIIGRPVQLQFMLEGAEIINGNHVLSAEPLANYNGAPAVQLKLNSEGTRLFSQATASENSGKSMDIVTTVDGQSSTISSPTINEQITGGVAIISGSFSTYEDAANLASQIMSGAFEVELTLKESNIISAELGEGAVKYGLIAGLIGLLLIIGFMAFIYRGLGLSSNISLLIFVVLFLFFLQAVPLVQLTLPGIAGIILTLGMSVDANIIIFERIKDEYRKGKSVTSSIHAGFKRALPPIIDGNVTSFIASVVLLLLGTGSIKGFAITMLIGLALSVFTSLVCTKFFVKNIMLLTESPRFYNLKRAVGVEEIPDEPQEEKPRKSKKNKISEQPSGGEA